MRLVVAGFLLCGVVNSLQIADPQPCVDTSQKYDCRSQGLNCLSCFYDYGGDQPFCVGPISRSRARQYCAAQESNGGINNGLGGLGNLGNLGGLGGLGGLGNYGGIGQTNAECIPGNDCASGPCVICNVGGGQRALCADQLNASRDFCNAPQFQGLCACPGGVVVTGVQSTPDNSIGISFVDPPVQLEDFQDTPDPAATPDTTGTPETQDNPDYQTFMVPRGLTRDHIRGETSK